MSSNHDEQRGLELKWQRGLPILLIVIIVSLVAAFVIFDGSGSGSRRASQNALVGSSAPEFSLQAVGGGSVALSDYLGAPVVVHFLASWCEACRDDLAMLANARDQFPDTDLVLLGITHNDEEPFLRDLADETGLSWPLLLDPNHEAWASYQAIDVPATYFIDTEGILRAVSIRPLDAATLSEQLGDIGVPSAG